MDRFINEIGNKERNEWMRENNFEILSVQKKTSAAIGAWKCNFPNPFG